MKSQIVVNEGKGNLSRNSIENVKTESRFLRVSKTKIEKRMRPKKDLDLIKTIIQLKKSNPEVAKEFSRPRRRWSAVNLKDLSHVEEGDLIVVGKVLSAGELGSKKKVVAWSFSEKAREKIKDADGEAILLCDEIKNNPKLNGLSIIK
jgi:ribosomal protein L18E